MRPAAPRTGIPSTAVGGGGGTPISGGVPVPADVAGSQCDAGPGTPTRWELTQV